MGTVGKSALVFHWLELVRLAKLEENGYQELCDACCACMFELMLSFKSVHKGAVIL